MELQKHSRTIRFYMFFYGIDARDLPGNLCPFFWKLMVALFFGLPLIILSAPKLILEKVIDGDINKESLFFSAFIGAIAYAAIACILGIFYFIGYFVFDYRFINSEIHKFFLTGGAVGIAIIFIVLIIFLIEKYKDANKTTPTPIKVVNEFVKAKYNKYCPTITWK